MGACDVSELPAPYLSRDDFRVMRHHRAGGRPRGGGEAPRCVKDPLERRINIRTKIFIRVCRKKFSSQFEWKIKSNIDRSGKIDPENFFKCDRDRNEIIFIRVCLKNFDQTLPEKIPSGSGWKKKFKVRSILIRFSNTIRIAVNNFQP